MVTGQEKFIEALRIIASSDGGKNAKALPLFLDAIESGLADKKDEAQAYAHSALILVGIEDFQKAYDNFKKAFSIKKDLIIDPEMELLLWNHAREVFGHLLCLFSQKAVDSGKWDKAIEYLKEAIDFTDYPDAHNRLGVIYNVHKKDSESSIKHYRYVLDNKDKLKIFKNYELTVEHVNNNLKRVKKSGCFIATAVMGSDMGHEVRNLTRFRDEILYPYWIGRQFIRIYYKLSPPFAEYLKKRKKLSKMVALLLIKPLSKLASVSVSGVHGKK